MECGQRVEPHLGQESRGATASGQEQCLRKEHRGSGSHGRWVQEEKSQRREYGETCGGQGHGWKENSGKIAQPAAHLHASPLCPHHVGGAGCLLLLFVLTWPCPCERLHIQRPFLNLSCTFDHVHQASGPICFSSPLPKLFCTLLNSPSVSADCLDLLVLLCLCNLPF